MTTGREAPRGAVPGTAEERLRAVLAAGRIGTWDLDLGTGELVSSDPCLANYGRAPGERFTYADLVASVHPDDVERWRRVVGDAIAACETFDLDYRAVWPDGTVRWVQVRGACTPGPDGVTALSGISLDVTDRKEVESSLRDARDRVASTLTAGEVATWTWSIRDDRVVADANLARLFGVTPEEAAGGPISAYVRAIHSDDRHRVAETIARALDARQAYEAPYRVRGADGEYRSVIARGRAEYDAAGAPLRLPGVVLDVSRQTRAEIALRESEERFRRLFETMDDGFCVIERLPGEPADYRYVEANRALEVQSGVSGVVGRTIREVIPTLPDEWFMVFDAVLWTGEPVRFERPLPPTARVLELHAFRIADDHRRVAVLFKDVTDRRRAADASRLLADASAALVELASVEQALQRVAYLAVGGFADECLVDVVEPDGSRRRVGAARDGGSISSSGPFPGLPRPLSTGRPELVTDVTDDDLVAVASSDAHLAALRARGVGSLISVPFLTRDVPAGALTLLTGPARYRFSHADLRTVEDLAGRLGVALENHLLYAALREADLRKDEFLATLAHELRNPLAPLRTGLRILQLAPPEDDAVPRTREMMERQLTHMVRLVDDLLDISRVSRGRIDLQRGPVALKAVVEAAVEGSLPVLEAARHRLAIDVPDDDLVLDADATRLAQVLSNLLNNAAKYTPEGGNVRLVAARDGTDAVVRIEDDGLGIAPDALPRLFELFTQVGTSLHRAQGGLGIGLALARSLVALHGGSIAAESPGLGRGSVFTVRLPLADGVAGPAPGPAPAPQPAPGRRILVVDDNVDGAEALSMLLELSGHVTRVSHDGQDALVAAREFRPELVILDIGLPGMDGYQVATHLRADPELRDAKLVALTGWGSEDARQRCREAGFDLHLTKPVSDAELDDVVSRFFPAS